MIAFRSNRTIFFNFWSINDHLSSFPAPKKIIWSSWKNTPQNRHLIQENSELCAQPPSFRWKPEKHIPVLNGIEVPVILGGYLIFFHIMSPHQQSHCSSYQTRVLKSFWKCLESIPYKILHRSWCPIFSSTQNFSIKKIIFGK